MSVELPNIYCWTLGDWSNDGHGRTSVVSFKTNLSKSEIQKAFADCCDELDVYQFADEYEYPYLDIEDALRLQQAGYSFPVKLDEETPDDDDLLLLDQDKLVDILMFMVTHERPDFKYELTKEIPSINGYWSSELNRSLGYGLF